MSTAEQLDKALHDLASGTKFVRVSTVVARKMLVQDEHVTIRGVDRWLRLENLGLGIYEVALAEAGAAKRTILLKK